MNLVEWFVNNPVKVTVGVILAVLFGALGLFSMPMQLTPEVELPMVTISTRWPGASPQEVERDIVQKQEEQLQAVEGMTKLSSESSDSLATVRLEFAAGTDMDSALVKVSSRLQQVRDYPQDVQEPVVQVSDINNFIAWFILHPRLPNAADFQAFLQDHPDLAPALAPAQRSLNAGVKLYRLRKAAEEHPEIAELLPKDVDILKMRRFAEDNVEARFERVDGVSAANVMGGRQEEMQVVVDPQELAARGLTIATVREALRLENKDTSAGDLWEGKRRWVIRARGRYESPEQIAATVLADRDGTPVYLRDVAEVRLGYRKASDFVLRYGEEMIALNCSRATGANVLDVMDGLRQVTRELNAGALRQNRLELTQVYDETEYVYSAIGLLTDNILVGGTLTVAVLLLFLRSLRSTIIIGLAIPISLVSSFLVLHNLGCTLNVISLAGLAFAVGMLVDNSVVTLENVFRHYQLGKSPRVASIRGISEVWGAVVASTLTTLAVFIPVVLIQDQAGQLFRDIALAISAAVGLSLIVSVTVIPVAASRLLRLDREIAPSPAAHASTDGPDHSEPRGALAFFDDLGRGFVNAIVGVNRLLQRGVAVRLLTVLGFAAAAVVGSYLMLPKVEYLPNGNRNLCLGFVLTPPGYSVEKLIEMGRTVEARMRPYWDVDVDSEQTAGLAYPAIADFFFVARGRNVFLGLRAVNPLRAAELLKLVGESSQDLAGTVIIPQQASLFERGTTAGRSIDVEIIGPDINKLVEMGQVGMGIVQKTLPGALIRPVPSLDTASPEIHLRRKSEQAAQLGMSTFELGYAVDALADGAYAGDYFTGGDTIDLTIIGRDRFLARTQDLESLSIATPTGDVLPLGAIAEIEYSSGPEQVNHRERERAITLRVTPPPELALEDAMDKIQREVVSTLLADPAVGGLYQVNLAGTADKLRDAWRAMRGFLLLATVITYLLMAALFESWIHPLVVMVSVPLGAVGGFAGLKLLNLFVLAPLDVVTMLGFIILIGTVVNNAILIVHQTLNHIREDQMTAADAVLESVRNRMRPIFMTTLTTLLGLLPLVISPGAGSELYRGLGSVLLGGLLVSTLFTLVLVPTLFTLFMDLLAFVHRRGWARLADVAAMEAAQAAADVEPVPALAGLLTYASEPGHDAESEPEHALDTPPAARPALEFPVTREPGREFLRQPEA